MLGGSSILNEPHHSPVPSYSTPILVNNPAMISPNMGKRMKLQIYDIMYIMFYRFAIINFNLDRILFSDLVNQKQHRTRSQA